MPFYHFNADFHFKALHFALFKLSFRMSFYWSDDRPLMRLVLCALFHPWCNWKRDVRSLVIGGPRLSESVIPESELDSAARKPVLEMRNADSATHAGHRKLRCNATVGSSVGHDCEVVPDKRIHIDDVELPIKCEPVLEFV